jgi:hypothetical protein
VWLGELQIYGCKTKRGWELARKFFLATLRSTKGGILPARTSPLSYFLMVKLSTWRQLTKGERKLEKVKQEQTEAIAHRTSARVESVRGETEGSSSVENARVVPPASIPRQERIGRGRIDRFGVANTSAHVVDLTATTGPEAGFPPPTPDPSCNPPLSRVTRLKTETATWTGIVQESGRFEWSRTNKTGNQEWLSAIEVEPREWQITKSRTTNKLD